MNKIGLLMLVILLLCGCSSMKTEDSHNVAPDSKEQNSTEDKLDEKSEIVKSLKYFHIEEIYDMLDFLENPWEAAENHLYSDGMYHFNFVEQDGRLVLSAMACSNNNTLYSHNIFHDIDGDYMFAKRFNSGEYCSRAVAFLCDENAIRQRFHENGIDDIRDIVIIEFADEKVGYTIAAITEKTAYYMTVPLAGEVYGDYIYQKIYTSEEFKKLYSPRLAKVYINEKEAKFSSETLLGEMYLEMDILDFLKAVGYECKYDEKTKEITAGEYTIRFEYDEEVGDKDLKYNEFIESADYYNAFLTTSKVANEPWNWVKYRNGRFLSSYQFFEDLCRELGYDLEYHYDNCSIHIYKKKTLQYVHIESIYDMFNFIRDPKEDNLYYGSSCDFRFVEQDGRLVLKDMAFSGETTFYDIDGDYAFAKGFNSSEYCSKAVAFLCDENAIRQRFHESGIDDIRDIVIIAFIDEKVGYTIAAVTEKTAYYMTVPLAGEVYGDYIYQKIYTSEEFKKFYSPRPAKVYINEEEVKFTSETLLGEMYLEMDILDFLKAVGYEYKYNEKAKEIIAGEYIIRFEYDEDGEEFCEQYQEFIEIAPHYDIFFTTPLYKNIPSKYALYRNGRYLGNRSFMTTLSSNLGYEIEYHYDDYSVHIHKKS